MSQTRKHSADSVLAAMMGQHWAIIPDVLETMTQIVERMNIDVDALERQRGEPLDNTRDVTVRDGIATLFATGPLIRYGSFFSRVSGATSYDSIATDFAAALDDPRIKAIVLSIDSPGGSVNGNDELAQMVFAARGTKPVVSYVSHLGASAAYWLAAASDEVVISPTSILGSIGVMASVRRPDQNSKTLEVVSNLSPNKNLDPSTDAGKASLLRTLDALASVFVGRVATYRGVSVETVMKDFGQGDVFVGQAAVDAGLADRMGNYESVLAELRDRTRAMPRIGVVPAPRQTGARASSSTSERLMATGSQAEPGATPPAAPAAPASTTTPSAPAAPAPAAPAPAPTAAATVADLSAVRAEAAKAERDRIAAIGALKKPGNEALIQSCIDDAACSVDMAKARLYDHERATAASQLNGLRGDERTTAAPKSASAPASSSATDARAEGKAAAERHRSLTSNVRRTKTS